MPRSSVRRNERVVRLRSVMSTPWVPCGPPDATRPRTTMRDQGDIAPCAGHRVWRTASEARRWTTGGWDHASQLEIAEQRDDQRHDADEHEGGKQAEPERHRRSHPDRPG